MIEMNEWVRKEWIFTVKQINENIGQKIIKLRKWQIYYYNN